MAVHDYRCSNCRNRSVAGLRATCAYNRTPRRMARVRATNKQRIFVGGAYHSIVRTSEEASRINAHIKAKCDEFKQKQRCVVLDADSGPARTSSPSGSC
jgi:hypothetical protein